MSWLESRRSRSGSRISCSRFARTSVLARRADLARWLSLVLFDGAPVPRVRSASVLRGDGRLRLVSVAARRPAPASVSRRGVAGQHLAAALPRARGRRHRLRRRSRSAWCCIAHERRVPVSRLVVTAWRRDHDLHGRASKILENWVILARDRRVTLYLYWQRVAISLRRAVRRLSRARRVGCYRWRRDWHAQAAVAA